LIGSIKEKMALTIDSMETPFPLLSLTSVASFNIQESIIHVALHIPINDFMPLEGKAL